jgi:hypothetical protein
MIALKVDFHSNEILCIDDTLENHISNVTSVHIYWCLFTPGNTLSSVNTSAKYACPLFSVVSI